jgi:hypothetical protein
VDKYERMRLRDAAAWRKAIKKGEHAMLIDSLTGQLIVRPEVHHVAGRKYGELSIPLDEETHREMTRRQMEEHPPSIPGPVSEAERQARFQLGAADLIESIADQMRADAIAVLREIDEERLDP